MKALHWIIFIPLLLMAHALPVSGAEGECLEVWRDGSKPRYLVNLDSGATISYEYDNSIQQYLSPNGRYSLQRTGNGSTLILQDRYTGATHTIADNMESPVWSSDGLRFSYLYQSPQGEKVLAFYQIASGTSQIVSENVTQDPVQWSDDGQWFIYREAGTAGSYDLLLYNIADGSGRVVSHDMFISSVGWSPDAMWLTLIQAESRQAARFELVLHNILTAEESVYSFESPVGEATFAWSPDGLRVALAVKMDWVFEYTQVYILAVPELDMIGSVYPMVARAGGTLWSPSGRLLILAARDTADFALVDTAAEPITAVEVHLDSYAPPYFLSPEENWSPDETYRVVYYNPGDLATGVIVLNNRGDVMVDAYVPSSLYDFEAQHWWIDAHHFLLREWDNGYDALNLFDARTGQRQTLFNPVAGMALSPDRERVALVPVTLSPSYEVRRKVQFYAWTGETFSLRRSVATPDKPRTMLWRADGSELVVLFEDQTLRAYNYEAETWRSIASLPDTDSWSMRPAPCAG